MDILNQVCTLEQAKRLKELGIEQESLCWYVHHITTELVVAFGYSWTDDPGYECYPQKWSAFNIAELGVMLPKRLKATYKTKDTTGLGGTWESHCDCPLEFGYDEKKKVHIVKYALVAQSKAINEAIARASLLIHLLDNKLITAEEVNQRLQAA